MLFLTFSNTDIRFVEEELVWRNYMTIKTLPTTTRVQLIGKREFAAVTLDKNAKIFVVHITFLEIMSLYLTLKIQIALLQSS